MRSIFWRMKVFSGTVALLKKELWERFSRFKKGNFDLMGLVLRLMLAGALVTVFVVFFKKFVAIYLAIPTDGAINRAERLYELLNALYFLLFVAFTVGSAAALGRELYAREDLKLLSAMPVRVSSIYLSGLTTVFVSKIPSALITLLPVSAVLAAEVPFAGAFLLRTLAACLLLPFLSVAAGSLLSLPFYAITRFLKRRYALTLVLVTLLAAGGFFVYAQLLGGIKELLLGDDLKYFFNENLMTGIAFLTNKLYPAIFFSQFVLSRGTLVPIAALFGIALGCLILSLGLVRVIAYAMRAPSSGGGRGIGGKLPRAGTAFGALFKRELVEILRTPGYAFSCFSTAAILPLMVYFCMSVGSSLVQRLVGIECSAELALFLSLLLGALCNVFCSTNISREGENFYTLKAMPLSAWKIFGAKLLFCLTVSALSQGASAAVLYLTGFVTRGTAIFLFFAGMVYSFAQICFATRYDFSRAKFSQEEDATAGESGGTASAVIVFGIFTSLFIGGGALALKLVSALRLQNSTPYAYFVLLSGGAVLLSAVLAFWYFARKLRRKYYEFSGGGLI